MIRFNKNHNKNLGLECVKLFLLLSMLRCFSAPQNFSVFQYPDWFENFVILTESVSAPTISVV